MHGSPDHGPGRGQIPAIVWRWEAEGKLIGGSLRPRRLTDVSRTSRQRLGSVFPAAFREAENDDG
jgi:hypothetical protein